jgi:hypothetical protein
MSLGMFFHEDMLKGPGAAFVFLLYAGQVGVHLVLMAVGAMLDPTEPAPELTAELDLGLDQPRSGKAGAETTPPVARIPS